MDGVAQETLHNPVAQQREIKCAGINAHETDDFTVTTRETQERDTEQGKINKKHLGQFSNKTLCIAVF